MFTAISVLLSFLLQAGSTAHTPLGYWRTIDDKTGVTKAIVRIYEQDGELFGRVEKLVDPNAERYCSRCKDELKDQPITGMVILSGLKKKGSEYSGGRILDPKSGSVYRCRIRMEDQGKKLSVRGYMGLSVLGRTQTWIREEH